MSAPSELYELWPDPMLRLGEMIVSIFLRDHDDPQRNDLTYAGHASAYCFFTCVLITIISQLFTSPFWPKEYKTHQKDKVTLWHTTICSLIPAIVVPYFSILAALEYYEKCGLETTVCPASTNMWFAYGFSSGYQLFDSLAMILFPQTMKKYLTPSLYWTLMAHHLLAVIFWTMAMAGGKGGLYIAYCLTTELTSLPLNLRWLAVEMGFSSSVELVLNGLVFLAFTVLRALPIPFLLWYLAQTDLQPHYNNVETVVAISGIIPVGLNASFYYTIVTKAIEALSGPKSPGKNK